MARRLLYVAFFLEVGLLLVVLPWSGFWERNYFAMTWPALRELLTNNFVRGAVTGLGLVNLYAGFADLAIVFAGRPPHPPPAVRRRRKKRSLDPRSRHAAVIQCLVTDRRRLAGADVSFDHARRLLLA